MTMTDDIPFPGMPQPEAPTLWGLAFNGEYVAPMATKRDAQLHQELCDELDRKFRTTPGMGGVRLNRAKVMVWPETAEQHAAMLDDDDAALPLTAGSVSR